MNVDQGKVDSQTPTYNWPGSSFATGVDAPWSGENDQKIYYFFEGDNVYPRWISNNE
jgi:hypothetical protein